MIRRSFLIYIGRLGAALLAAALLLPAAPARTQETLTYERIRDVVYRKKEGVALTMDVLKPARQSGIGVLFMVSGGWVSNHNNINPGMMRDFLKHGQTVFMVVHGSQPRFKIQDIVQDIDRAVRFVRYHAAEYGVDPNRLGISGGSAGGHLSLYQGAHGSDGNPSAPDPVDRVSSRVQAVACFFPPTDFLNYGTPGQNALATEVLQKFWVAWRIDSREPAELEKVARETSPITYVTKQMPPSLIVHGDIDKLVPIQQSQVMMAKLEELGVPHKLVTKEGKDHGWAGIENDVETLAAWFDEHLKAK